MEIFLETLLYIIKDNKVLLIKKKRGLGKGYFNGIGGKVEPNESPEEAAVREAKEEVGIVPKNIEFRGLLEFWNENDSLHFVYVYTSTDYKGDLRETDEAKPFWFDIESIPYENMWEDDKYWLPLVLRGQSIYGRFFFKDWKLKDFRVYTLKENKFEN